ncbi:LysM peptidoglycan-binding domain-containing protein [Sporosarcina ureilytica]|uniref:LysM domain-containing protein n=1 Tax=Sporosarcina ureilytica TaxID=298596 RepID=A0A1D8JFX6_9BACL|nr:LysM domain-containing protein [Sporosarcina ureilytica]AOV07619.1 hypothetical protein BI350_08780 [Sporosarcina ureilytica]
MDVHIVQRGDTLWKIARQHGISFEELKRVNAHLANPDYIVPGMKIFLPNKVQGKGEVNKPSTSGGKLNKVEKVESVKKVEKVPVKPPVSLPQAHQVPREPVPIPVTPKAPKLTSKPVEESKAAPLKATKPIVEQAKPTPTPTPAPAPTPPPAQAPMQPTFPMQPYPYTLIGIPCGWLPIYDADCYPHVHPGQMHPMPPPQPPMTQLPVQESTHFRPSARPSVPEKGMEMESPMIGKETFPGFISPPAPPVLHFPSPGPELMPSIESPTHQMPKAKPEVKPEVKPEARPKPAPTPAPRPLPPATEMPMQPVPVPDWSYPQSMYPVHAGQSSPCGCSQFAPMPLPVQQHPFCNACNQPIGPHPMQPMPYPIPNYWHGMY